MADLDQYLSEREAEPGESLIEAADAHDELAGILRLRGRRRTHLLRAGLFTLPVVFLMSFAMSFRPVAGLLFFSGAVAAFEAVRAWRAHGELKRFTEGVGI